MKPTAVAVIEFGLGGNILHCYADPDGSTMTVCGYDVDPDRFVAAVRSGEYADYYLEGAHVVDVRAVVERRPRLALDAPLCDTALAEGEERPFDRVAARELLPGLEGAFLNLAAHAVADNRWRGLDLVAPGAWTAWWRAHGAQTGRWRDGRIEWETPE